MTQDDFFGFVLLFALCSLAVVLMDSLLDP